MPKAAVLTKYGPPEVRPLERLTNLWPEPGPGQVRIRIKAAWVSSHRSEDPPRATSRPPFHFPLKQFSPFKASGVVDALGPSVSGVKEGDEVASLLPGTWGLRRIRARLLVDPQAAQRQLERCRRPARVSRSCCCAAPSKARDFTGARHSSYSAWPARSRNDRHPARHLPTRQGHRRRVAAGPRLAR